MVLIRLSAIYFPVLSTSEAWVLQFTVGTSEDGAVYYNSEQTQAINSALTLLPQDLSVRCKADSSHSLHCPLIFRKCMVVLDRELGGRVLAWHALGLKFNSPVPFQSQNITK